MLIQHRQTENKGMFYIEEEGNILAEMTYAHSDPEHIIIEHTQVDDELKGQNVGFTLVNHAVEYARQHNLKIMPVCPFAKAVFDKKPDLRDVLEA